MSLNLMSRSHRLSILKYFFVFDIFDILFTSEL